MTKETAQTQKEAKTGAQATQRVVFQNLVDPGIDVRFYYKCKDFTYDQHAIPGETYDIPKEAFEYFKSLTISDFIPSGVADVPMTKIQLPRFAFMIP